MIITTVVDNPKHPNELLIEGVIENWGGIIGIRNPNGIFYVLGPLIENWTGHYVKIRIEDWGSNYEVQMRTRA